MSQCFQNSEWLIANYELISFKVISSFHGTVGVPAKPMLLIYALLHQQVLRNRWGEGTQGNVYMW